MSIIISGNRKMILNKQEITGGKLYPSFKESMRNEKDRSSNIKISDDKVLEDLKQSEQQICSLDPNSKGCKVVRMHIEDAEKSPPGSPLNLVEPSVLNTVVKMNKPKVTYDVYTTNCQCEETVEEVKEKLETGSCDSELDHNKEVVLDYMEELVDKSNKNTKRKEIKVKEEKNKKLIEQTAAVLDLDCTTEQCVLANVIKYNAETEGENRIKTCCDTKFKPKGPRNKRDWLSNGNTDKTLENIEKEFEEFYPYKTTMIDFDTGGDNFVGNKGDEALSNCAKNITKFLDNNKTCFGCIINTDSTESCKKGGKCGSHWVCIFIDCRKVSDVPWTIEYFDSVGDPPDDEICIWQEKIKKILEKYRQDVLNETGGVLCEANNIQHQRENNECGVYCSYFIRARVEGIPFSRFLNRAIPDYVMIEYRRNLYSE